MFLAELDSRRQFYRLLYLVQEAVYSSLYTFTGHYGGIVISAWLLVHFYDMGNEVFEDKLCRPRCVRLILLPGTSGLADQIAITIRP